MILKLTLGVLVVCAIGCSGPERPGGRRPPASKKPILKCAMRWTGNTKVTVVVAGDRITADVPDRAEVTITNISNANVDIGSRWGPDAHLDLRVKDPTGANVKTEPLDAELSTQSLFKPTPYILRPGEVYRCEVDLLEGVPEEKRVTGTYQVKAVYTIDNKEYTSDWVEIKWPWKKK